MHVRHKCASNPNHSNMHKPLNPTSKLKPMKRYANATRIHFPPNNPLTLMGAKAKSQPKFFMPLGYAGEGGEGGGTEEQLYRLLTAPKQDAESGLLDRPVLLDRPEPPRGSNGTASFRFPFQLVRRNPSPQNPIHRTLRH